MLRDFDEVLAEARRDAPTLPTAQEVDRAAAILRAGDESHAD